MRTPMAVASLLLVLLAGCATPERPVRPTLYDFGPGALGATQATREAPLPPLALDDVSASASLDGTAVLYRLAYADAHQLRPYAMARWSAPPAQLVRQRLRDHLSVRRPVLNLGEGTVFARSGGSAPNILRLELEEFSHLFESPTQSAGLLRLRATLVENTLAGERLLAQRLVVVQRPAASADAPGGVRALAAATDAAAQEIAQWLATVR